MLSAQELIKEGSDPNVRDNAGWTPLVRLQELLWW